MAFRPDWRQAIVIVGSPGRGEGGEGPPGSTMVSDALRQRVGGMMMMLVMSDDIDVR